MTNKLGELVWLLQLHRCYDRDTVSRWIQKAELGRLKARAGQLERWRATLQELDATGMYPWGELSGPGIDCNAWLREVWRHE